MVSMGLYDTRRENEEVGLSVFIQEAGHVDLDMGRRKSTGDGGGKPTNIQPRRRNEVLWAAAEKKQTSSFPQGLTNCLTKSGPQGGSSI